MNSLNLLFHIFLLVVALLIPQVVLGNAELRALMDFKSSLDPENMLLRSWTNDGDPCSGSFLGVACNEHQKVANISLPGTGLSGKLSPMVAELKCLSGLYLHYNHLSGEIPTEISNLNELVDLYLDFNNLSGSIPQDIGNLSSLQVLQLGYNQLEGEIPQQMGELKQLNSLALQHNKLTGQIPLSLGNLEMLRRLNLSFNNFNGVIPKTIAHIANLEVLDVQNNSLSGIIPPGIGYLHSNIANKPTIVHQNISVEKVILDHQFNPLIMDAGLPKLLADDVVFSVLKVSAAMGYLAPEYITTGRFTEKSDMYAFGVIVLQILSGKTVIGGSIRKAFECFRYEDFVDTTLKGVYSKSEAEVLSNVAMLCTNDLPEKRPTIREVIQELSMCPAHSL